MDMDMDEKTRGGNEMNEGELTERIALIESMMRAGRKTTEYWGWNFVLWGVAILIAVAWASFVPSQQILVWPVTMVLAALLSIGIARRRTRNQPRTDRTRYLHAIWRAAGWGIFVFAFPVGFSGHAEPHVLIAGIETLLGVAQIASGSMLRWTTQIMVGVVWWAAAIGTCFIKSSNGAAILFVAALFVCNICFGIYLMIREGRDKARARGGEVQHA
jgi:hypothetical protein